jgi:hypothetical protein
MSTSVNDAKGIMNSVEEGTVGSPSWYNQEDTTNVKSSILNTSSLKRKRNYQKVVFAVLIVLVMSIAVIFFARSLGKTQITPKVWIDEDGNAGN